MKNFKQFKAIAEAYVQMKSESIDENESMLTEAKVNKRDAEEALKVLLGGKDIELGNIRFHSYGGLHSVRAELTSKNLPDKLRDGYISVEASIKYALDGVSDLILVGYADIFIGDSQPMAIDLDDDYVVISGGKVSKRMTAREVRPILRKAGWDKF